MQSRSQAGGSHYPGKKPAPQQTWQNQNYPAQQVSGPNVQAPKVPSPYTSPANKVPAWANKTYDQTRDLARPQSGGQNMGSRQARPQQNLDAYAQGQYNQQQQYAQNGAYPQQNSAPALRGAAKPSWLQRLGFGNVKTDISGHAKVGLAALDRSGADADVESIVDIDVRAEVSAITDGGLEYGAGLRARAQRDRHRRGFGGRVGDCPAGVADCNAITVGGSTRAIKGHTGQFYTDGRLDRKETELALEGAYLFLRSSYGDVVLGRDDGAAYLFSVGAPSLVAVNASNSPVDYTGLDSVKTVNDASGFSEKIVYTSPRLLGDSIGVGVQFGASYALNTRACGVDYCVKSNGTGAQDPFAPQIENVIELGVALDRTFNNGFSAELTGTYARGSEDSGLAAFDSLSSYGAGLELKYSDFVFGTSYLKSNNGFAGQGDYTSYDAGLTWKPSNWGFTASYGHADDDIAKLTSDQGVLAVSYDLGKMRLGTGVQYISRTVPIISGTGRDSRKEDAAALFLEVGIDF